MLLFLISNRGGKLPRATNDSDSDSSANSEFNAEFDADSKLNNHKVLQETWVGGDPWSKDYLKFKNGKAHLAHRVPSNPSENTDTYGSYTIVSHDKHSVCIELRWSDMPRFMAGFRFTITDDPSETLTLSQSGFTFVKESNMKSTK